MRKFILFALLVSVLACRKDKDDDKLPKAFDQIVKDNKNCNCDPFIDKYNWRGQFVYQFQTSGNFPCEPWVSWYDEKANKIDLFSVADQPVFVKRVWTCKP